MKKQIKVSTKNIDNIIRKVRKQLAESRLPKNMSYILFNEKTGKIEVIKASELKNFIHSFNLTPLP